METLNMVQVPEQQMGIPKGIVGIPAKDPDLSFKNSDFAADMAKLAEKAGQSMTPSVPPLAVPMTPPSVPVQPEKATVIPEATKAPEAVAVPEKFQTPDGKIDVQKVEQSTLNAQEALDKYLAKEKELKRKINEVHAQERGIPTPVQTTQPSQSPALNPDFAKQIEADIQAKGAGVVLAQLFNAAKEVAKEEIRGDVEQIKSAQADVSTRQQIEAIGKVDPWVYTEEGVGTLTKILNEQPYLWNAADPYKAAYLIYNGVLNVASRSQGKVLTPNPTVRPTAPVPSGQASLVTQTPIILNSKQDIDNHLKTLTPAQQEEFFKRAGLPGLR
jgi:hypothetical protein